MFTAALTGEAARRLMSLSVLSTCPAWSPIETTQEQAWTWTITAATEAASGNCDSAVALDPRVDALDHVHHETKFLRDPGIMECLSSLVVYRENRQHCLQDRATAMRRVQTIADPKTRGQALSALRECSPAK